MANPGRDRETTPTPSPAGTNSRVEANVKAQGECLASHTILEMLLCMNTDERAALEVGLYYRQAHLGEPGGWAGADLVADWSRRNVRIFSHVARLVDSPGRARARDQRGGPPGLAAPGRLDP